MDLASLITPGPAPISTRPSRPSYSPSANSYQHSTGSYFPTMPASTITPTTSFSRSRAPQPPLSPPVDDQPKCSLPSISSLLGTADTAPVPPAKRQRLSPPRRESDSWLQQSTSYETSALPPTPPLRPGSGFHSSTHSPSSKVETAPFPPQQPSMTLPSPTDRSSISSQGSSVHHNAPYASPAPSVASYSSPIDPPSAASTMYYSRPASSATYQGTVPPPPQSTVSTAAPSAVPAPSHQQIISPVTPAWQHHHYFPPSSSTPYQQNHDRYICRTCHKAFSRPSSLRIHSHSHTGEKPFRCTHAGCGKAFSVRSNMKRHERGCHSGRPVATAMV
ncbi:hypothetical protein FE257_001720 [Aspergillus nanangensis]|uniref:C2H2-type domain-containing protein n=1 Tax=Aspergillus nanangensis TaxID=2582783 RepID=A0AAD4GNR4_ASPNN|nr:hypothetical protein FE257_001720 [Aspergillus nanangensis]